MTDESTASTAYYACADENRSRLHDFKICIYIKKNQSTTVYHCVKILQLAQYSYRLHACMISGVIHITCTYSV